jgi:phosphonate transport system substrate-binding protein
MRLFVALCVAGLSLVWGAVAEAADIVRVLLLPYTNTVALMRVHQPLRAHLQQQLGQPVELFTSADFPAHFDEIKRGDYDIAVTGPHFGAWAVTHGARPLLRYSPSLSPILAVRKDSPIRTPEQVRGKVVILSNRISTSSLAGERWLADHGLLAGRDYTLRTSPTHTTAIMAVALGEADAAITTHTPLHQSPEDVRSRIDAVVAPIAVPHLFTIANHTLPDGDVRRFRAALLSFGESVAGKTFFAETGYQGYVALTAADVAAMGPIVDLLLKAMP